jgi:hypothetical protein
MLFGLFPNKKSVSAIYIPMTDSAAPIFTFANQI